MKKVKSMFHRHETNVLPSQAQVTAAPVASTAAAAATTTTTSQPGVTMASTEPGTGLGFGGAPGMSQMGTGLAQQAPLSQPYLSSSTGAAGAPSSSFLHPFASQYNLPPTVANWQQGQPIPQGWRLGRRGFLKPAFVLPSQYSSWQQGQPLPEGYRMSKRGTLRPVNYFNWWQQQSSLGGAQVFERTTVIERDVLQSQQAPLTTVNTTAPVVEVREKPAVIQEIMKPSLREEIQPIIHREREQLEIREEIQPIYEKTVQPTVIEERQLPAEMRPEIRTGVMPVIAEGPRASVVVEDTRVETFRHAPIIEETVRRKIIEEIQPVIHRETVVPKIIREVQPIYEKVIEAPIITYQTLPPRYIGAAATPATQLVEEKIVTTTTTTTQSEFLPSSSLGTSSLGTSSLASSSFAAQPASTSTFLSQPATSTFISQPSTFTSSSGATQVPISSTTATGGSTIPMNVGAVPAGAAAPLGSQYEQGLSQGLQQGLKLEEQQRFATTQGAPSTFQYK